VDDAYASVGDQGLEKIIAESVWECRVRVSTASDEPFGGDGGRGGIAVGKGIARGFGIVRFDPEGEELDATPAGASGCVRGKGWTAVATTPPFVRTGVGCGVGHSLAGPKSAFLVLLCGVSKVPVVLDRPPRDHSIVRWMSRVVSR